MRKKENFHSTIFKNKAFLVSFLTNSIIMACSNNSDDWPG